MDHHQADAKIKEILDVFGIPFAGNVWRVQGTAVIYHRVLEDIARQVQITYDPPKVLRAERDEAVIMVSGKINRPVKNGEEVKVIERADWTIGEALINVNYRVSGKQAGYVYAMAEKRGKDRLILKLLDLDGLVRSEEDAKDVNEAKPAPLVGPEGVIREHEDEDVTSHRLRVSIGEFKSYDKLRTFMRSAETQADLKLLSDDDYLEIEALAKDRLRSLKPPEERGAPPRGGSSGSRR